MPIAYWVIYRKIVIPILIIWPDWLNKMGDEMIDDTSEQNILKVHMWLCHNLFYMSHKCALFKRRITFFNWPGMNESPIMEVDIQL